MANEFDKNKEQASENYLNNFINNENKDVVDNINKNVSALTNKAKADVNLEYLNVDINMLPLGRFYKNGTIIKIRSAKVSEIQAYSMVDENNFVDVTEKMNDILATCVKFIHPNGAVGSYRDLRDGDRLYLIFMIRELTFQKGNSLAKDVQCPDCKKDFKIFFRSTTNSEYLKSFVNYDMPEKLEKYFNPSTRTFDFYFEDKGSTYSLAPPTIGIQECFYKYLKNNIQAEKKPNLSFTKIIPYTLHDKNNISDDILVKLEKEYSEMSGEEDMKIFQILNQAIDKMLFGIKELKGICKCGVEVHTKMSFPNGAATIFVIPDFFDEFDKK